MYDMIASETMDGLKQPITAFCVGGGGSHLERGSVAFNYINRTLSDYDITPHNVHGVTDDTTSSRVRSPSEQYEEIMDNVSDRGKEGPVFTNSPMHGYNCCPSGIIIHDKRKHKHSTCNFFTPITKPQRSNSTAKF